MVLYMLNDFFKDSAQVIESLTELEELCCVIAERIVTFIQVEQYSGSW